VRACISSVRGKPLPAWRLHGSIQLKYRKHSLAGDGPPFVDPLFAMELARSGDRGRSRRDDAQRDRKTKQLCRQVFQAVSLALAGECDDEVLRDLTVESVTPAPNASRLLVCVALPAMSPSNGPLPRPGEPVPSAQLVMERLAVHHPRLRRCVAAAVTRKRAPELTFLPVSPGSMSGPAGDRNEVKP
jgi:hypothetical protein